MYDIGDAVRITASFYNSATPAVLTDPTTVTVRIKPSNAAATTYTYGTDAAVVKSATGVYYIDVTITASDRWRYRWAGTGALIQAEEGSFNVRRQAN
jgi:hypothetical protein